MYGSPNASNSNNAWNVNFGAYVGNISVGLSDDIGVRPVITILKSKLS